jgi:hypothetical protein
MIKYQSFQYIYPPRPKNPIPSTDLNIWDNGMMLAQPKINGSNCTIYTNGKDIYVYNRHGQRLTGFDIPKEEILNLYRGNGWWVLNGEYTNKSKQNENGSVFSHKFCLFDILVKNGEYLIGTTFQQRVDMMLELYGSPKGYISQITENTFVIKSFYNDFTTIFNDLSKIDMIEGLVLKRKSAKLETGTSENNNSKSQIKSRKATKNYKY